MGEILRTTGELLVQSFGCFVIPALTWIWNLVVVFGLWLIVGGVVSLPLTLLLVKKLHDRLGWCDWWLTRAVIWTLASLALWFYIHLWVASAIWFDTRVGELSVHGWGLVVILMALWLIGFIGWWAFGNPTFRSGVRRNL